MLCGERVRPVFVKTSHEGFVMGKRLASTILVWATMFAFIVECHREGNGMKYVIQDVLHVSGPDKAFVVMIRRIAMQNAVGFPDKFAAVGLGLSRQSIGIKPQNCNEP